MKTNRVITRFAPSPTGSLHMGAARTAVFNYIYARKHHGQFILRLDDTDQARSDPAYSQDILDSLEWLGLDYDHFYRQSDRAAVYAKYLQQLIKSKAAYISREPARDGGGLIDLIRLNNPGGTITFTDQVRGEITFDTTELGDFIIARDGQALYHLASVIDDLDFGITHIIRGEDHISNTPRQIMILAALGAKRPVYAHVPLIVADDRTKLSKRHGAKSVLTYKDQGILPEALINFLVLLGWSPQAGSRATNQEVFTMDELIDRFDLSGLSHSAATFNPDKLAWLNRAHLKLLSADQQADLISQYLDNKVKVDWSKDLLIKLAPILFERADNPKTAAETLNQGHFDYLLTRPIIDHQQLETIEFLPQVIQLIAEIPATDFTPNRLKTTLWDYATKHGRRQVLAPVRQILTGLDQSPDPFTIGWLLGKTETINRLQQVIDQSHGQ